MPGVSFQSRADAVIQYAASSLDCDPVEPVPLVWRVDTASREIDRPCGVAFSLQISADSVEPTVASRSRNLLSHDDRGPAGTDEAMKVRPQMPWIICSETFSRRAERLAGAASGPEGGVVRPSSKSSCDGPETASGEEMDLGEACKVIWRQFLDGAGVDDAGRDHACVDHVLQDVRGGRVDLVVEGGHAAALA